MPTSATAPLPTVWRACALRATRTIVHARRLTFATKCPPLRCSVAHELVPHPLEQLRLAWRVHIVGLPRLRSNSTAHVVFTSGPRDVVHRVDLALMRAARHVDKTVFRRRSDLHRCGRPRAHIVIIWQPARLAITNRLSDGRCRPPPCPIRHRYGPPSPRRTLRRRSATTVAPAGAS